MSQKKPASRLCLSKSTRHALALLLLLFAAYGAARAQSSATDGTTPAGMAQGAPAGSYRLSGFDSVNFFNGHLSFNLPLLNVGSRGGAQIPVLLPIAQPWRVERHGGDQYLAAPNWRTGETTADLSGFTPGSLDIRFAGEDLDSGPCPGYLDHMPFYGTTLTRLTFTAPDGTEYELRDQQTGGRPFRQLDCRTTGFPRGRLFVTADGSSATFIADEEVRDLVRPDEGGWGFPTGYLFLRDGTRFRIVNGLIRWMRDRNGNMLTFEYYENGIPNAVILRSGVLVSKIKDSLNREVTFLYDQTSAEYGLHDQITFKGFGGAARTIRIGHTRLHDLFRSGFTTKTYAQLFPGTDSSTYTLYDPYKVSAVWLPDGRAYTFLYNSHGELSQFTLPAGGYVQYDYDMGVDRYDDAGNYYPWHLDGYASTYRRLVAKRTYTETGALAGNMTISLPEHFPYDANWQLYNRGFVDVDSFDASGARLSRERHFFYGSPMGSISAAAGGPARYPAWREGKEYKTELFNGALTLLRRIEHTWQQRGPVSWWVFPNCGDCSSEIAPQNSPRVAETVTTLADTNQVSKQTFGYDQYNNLTDVYDYDFGIGAAGALLRRTHTDYVTTNIAGGAGHDYACDPATTCSDAAITPNVIHLRELPAQQWVSTDAAGVNKQSLAAYAYDQTGLTDRAGITGLCTTYPGGVCTSSGSTAYVTRGNATAVTRYADAAAAAGPVTVSSAYDIAGNIVSTTDPRGFTVEVSYADSFCNGAGCGGSFTPNTFAYPTSATTPVPDMSTQFGFQSGTFGANFALATSTRYDFWTGLVFSTTDANNKTTSFEYADLLDRPTAQVRPDGGRTDYHYSDAAGNLYVRTLTDLDAGRRIEARQYFDGLGRAFRSLTYENQDPSNPWIAADVQYDALDRVVKQSLPYRSAGGATPLTPNQWSNARRTETEYDALDRVKKTTTMPDTAVVTTAYTGNSVTATDQAGRARKSVYDALGRVRDVYEDPSGLNYLTSYTYDAPGNLRTVTQGAQAARSFLYDSLGRLASATQPESGTTTFTYDANSNLKTRTDARGVTTTYEYDRLNRNFITTYAGGGTSTPTKRTYYDWAVNGRGRFHWSETMDVSATAHDNYDAAGRVTQFRQIYAVNGAWGPGYSVERAYNKAGGVTSQTYPSERVVTYSYDILGRPGDHNGQPAVAGNLGDGVQRTYASEVRYHELGGLQYERYGTDTPLYNRRFYNGRGQLAEIRLGTYHATDTTWWNRGAIINHYSNSGWGASGGGPDNNGNLQRQEVYVPNDDQISGYVNFVQYYGYDTLNRLTSIEDKPFNGSPDFYQSYNYDRWGNRTVNASGTWNAPAPQLTPVPANNRLAPPAGYTMTYDDAGNLTYDNYTGAGTRAYDAENRMTSAQDFYGQTTTYTYDADGKRVRRRVAGGAEVWQVYGMGGELLAEYAPNASPASPQKEYGYRGGELLVTADPAGSETVWVEDSLPAGAVPAGDDGWNWVGASPAPNSGSAAHQSAVMAGFHQHFFFSAAATLAVGAGEKLFAYVYLDPANPPTEVMLQWNDGSWEHRAYWGADQIGVGTNGTESRRYMGALPAAGGWVRLEVPASLVGLEGHTLNGMAFTLYGGRATWDRAGKAAGGTGAGVQWLVADQLGTPRMVVDKAGTLAGVKRHDYLPFGEEVTGDGTWRTTGRGYNGDGVRQKFTGYERDPETGLDYARARYFSSAQGRFTGVDPLLASGRALAPQTWNRYSYTLNNPLRLTDPTGMAPRDPDDDPQRIPKPVIIEPVPIEPPPTTPLFPPPSSTTAGPVVYDDSPAPMMSPIASAFDAALGLAERVLASGPCQALFFSRGVTNALPVFSQMRRDNKIRIADASVMVTLPNGRRMRMLDSPVGGSVVDGIIYINPNSPLMNGTATDSMFPSPVVAIASTMIHENAHVTDAFGPEMGMTEQEIIKQSGDNDILVFRICVEPYLRKGGK